MAVVMDWRHCLRYPAYEVSECGDVRRIRTKTRMRGFIDADGYVRYSLRDGDGKKGVVGAHQLVASAFLGPPPTPYHQVAHNNGSRLGCHWSNLRWATVAANQNDRVDHGTAPAGSRNGHAKLSDDDVAAIRREYRLIKQPGSGRRVAELDEHYGICRAQVIRIARGLAWSHLPMPQFEEAA